MYFIIKKEDFLIHGEDTGMMYAAAVGTIGGITRRNDYTDTEKVEEIKTVIRELREATDQVINEQNKKYLIFPIKEETPYV